MNSFPTQIILVSSFSKRKEKHFMREKICTNNPSQLIPFSLHIRENNELSTPENQISQLQLFPNPTENTINLKLLNQKIEEIVIYDLQGRVIFQENKSGTSNNSQIDVSAFSNGVYIVQVMSTNGNVSSSKFIKK